MVNPLESIPKKEVSKALSCQEWLKVFFIMTIGHFISWKVLTMRLNRIEFTAGIMADIAGFNVGGSRLQLGMTIDGLPIVASGTNRLNGWCHGDDFLILADGGRRNPCC
jgi:orotate phosphoribosyltransferase-like protein